jgi:hypothetical protein
VQARRARVDERRAGVSAGVAARALVVAVLEVVVRLQLGRVFRLSGQPRVAAT